MTLFYMVRHGRTQYNDQGIVQGWSDSPLTQEGIDQAKQLHVHLKGVPFAFGISSTSKRASDTMDYIVQHRFPTQTSDGLKETNFGSLEETPVATAFPNKHIRLESYPELGGESDVQCMDRFMKTLEESAQQYPNDSVLVVSHGNVLYTFLRYIDESFAHKRRVSGVFWYRNCSVTIVSYEKGQFHLLRKPDIYYREK